MATLLKVLNKLADIKSARGVALRGRTQVPFSSQSSEIGLWAFVQLEQRFPSWRNSPDRPISSIIALGGSFDGLRSPGARFEAAVRLAKTFHDAKVVFSGREEAGQGADARAAFIAEGIEPNRIVVEERSANTAENAAFSAVLLHPKKEYAEGDWRFQKSRLRRRSLSSRTVISQPSQRAQTALKEILGLIYYRITGRSDSLYPAP
jgi:hypothetical protein